MKVFVAGHNGLVGSEIVKQLGLDGHEIIVAARDELDLRDRPSVFDFIRHQNPDAVIIAAAVVGGIKANMERPVEFLSDNLQIQTNLIDACHNGSIERVIFLGSSCIYPKFSDQPIKETSLLTGPLEPTNEAYALAKIAGVKLITSYNQQYGHNWISLMPTNVYGSKDNFLNDDSHVLPALIRKIRTAKETDARTVELWGTGSPQREFIHSTDLASAVVFILSQMPISESLVNIGTGYELSIKDLALMLAAKIGFEGEIKFNPSMPDGTPRKILDSSILRNLGWTPRIELDDGVDSLLSEDQEES